MNSKWQITIVVMLIILGISTVFFVISVRDSRQALNIFVDGKCESIRAIVSTLEQAQSHQYIRRINSFVDLERFPQREKLIRAFAMGDRETLQEESQVYLRVFRQENSNFSTFGWFTADNINFLRVHKPSWFGDDVSKMRPDIVAANRTQELNSGYLVALIGLEYRVVQPVSYEGEHLGVVQFGIRWKSFLDSIHNRLKLPVALVIPDERAHFIKESLRSGFSRGGFTIQSDQLELFQKGESLIDWSADQQKMTFEGRHYLILNALSLLNFKQHPEGHIFVALDITEQRNALRKRMALLLMVSLAMLLGAAALIYLSYDSLLGKINDLNLSLKKANFELESRVQERTVKLQESEARLQSILEQSPVGILIAKAKELAVEYANPACCKMLGYSQDELHALKIPDLHRPEDVELVTEDFKSIARKGGGSTVDIPFLCKDGKILELDVLAASLEIRGEPCLAGFLLDRSVENKLRAQLQRDEKMKAIGMMAGGVAHDLNNMLAVIVNYPEMILEDLPPDSELRELAEAILQSGKRATEVVADLLTVARGVACAHAPHDINDLIAEYLHSPEGRSLQQDHPGITFHTDLQAAPAFIDCSPVHIKKIAMNLLNNACEALDMTGEVHISTSNFQVTQGDSSADKPPSGDYILFTIADNGPGIAPADLEHIFEPFYTKKVMGKSGTGLGLAVVWNTVQDHQAHIFVDSSPAGTCFQIYFLPSKAEVPAATEGLDMSAPTTIGNEHILIIDDEQSLRTIASRILNKLGYRVDTVSSGEAALQFLNGQQVDLVIIDMIMDPGMNGRQTFEKILKIFPDQKAIIASGYSESDDVKAALQLGASSFIGKPYTKAQLAQVVSDALTS